MNFATLTRPLIIAEAGVNHNGDLALARQLIDAAAAAGADFVKFQTFRTEKLVSQTAPRAEYQKVNAPKYESQYAMLKQLELDEAMHHDLMAHCRFRNIGFMSSPFDLESIELLSQLGVEFFKVPSGEITNAPYLAKIGSLHKPVILSTGMAKIDEIGAALEILFSAGTPRQQVIVLHCNTQYPTPPEDVNLRAMHHIAREFAVPVGYSDHTLGIEIPIAAVALGAVCIEKHFTLDRTLPGPDQAASLEPAELQAMVHSIHQVAVALGDGIKRPSPSEIGNRDIVRKSIHVAAPLSARHILQAEDLIMKRPGTGLSPMEVSHVVGRALRHAVEADHQLQWEDLV
ncbi:N,N'-diacetyllegionaminate synthase [Catalinimonas alkaloidigena]|uniref:N,N'-diacetyllegionaminate synthase n=1 Tax=Catalinimonas alkaloidigena TaxID=1075417 RepID=A0A1G8ZMR0_9BACT|nr:N-acetylneuraminate synthase [Catalinimonas alkaloidigena]SDK15440.1 N,N'-diacetyllegionaminate synthase [Catalinimonas alkaloidigena]